MIRTCCFVQTVLLAIALGASACSSDSATSDGGGGRSGAGGPAVTPSSSGGGSGSGGTDKPGGGAPGIGGSGTAGGSAAGGVSGSFSGGFGGAPPDAGMGGLTSSNGGSAGAGGKGDGGQLGATAGSSSMGGASGWNPCVASPCVVLPLGDSITHGYNSSDDAGYRSALFKLAVADNRKLTFIGSLSNGPAMVSGQTFPKTHEGHDGITVTGITGYVPPTKAFSTTPNFVLLHIGTNDMTSNANPSTTASQLDALLTNIVKAAPNALVVVAKIVPLGYSNSNYDQYIAKIPDIVKAHADKNEHVVLVDMSKLPASDIRGNGNVHPTDKGYADMADLWYGVLKLHLPN